MFKNIKIDTEMRMDKCVHTFKNQIKKMRTGCASIGLLENIIVNYYDKLTPLHKLANITVENVRTLKIDIFDRSIGSAIEKAIISSNLGLSTSTVGTSIRVLLPSITEEHRKNLIKAVRNEAEQGRISIRNIRREANDKIKVLLKSKKIGKDDDRRSQEEIQKLTDEAIKKIDMELTHKEKEIMKF